MSRVKVTKLGQIIKKSGLKQKSIAQLMGISESSFYNKTSGKTNFTAAESLQLRDILGMSWDEYHEIFFADLVPNLEQEAKK